jgi:O-antigen/teichoic acid export membrane protein
MNRLRKVIGNTVISLLGQAVTWTSTMILTIAYGRFLGDVKFGELYFAISFVALIGFPIDAGFNQQMIRDVAVEPSKALRYLTNIICFKFILWATLYGVILLLCWLLGYPPEVYTLVTICGITLLTTSMSSVMSSLHYTFERVTFPVIGSILEKTLDALVGTILLYNGADVLVVAWVLLGGSCANLLWQTSWVLRLVGIPCTFDVPLARKLIRTSIPFILYGALTVVYYRLDTVLLSLMTSAAVIGWYGAAYRLFDTLVFLPSLVINAIMYPVFSKLTAHSEKELQLAVEKSLNFLLFCGMPITVGLMVAAPSLIGFLYHQSGFNNAVPAMQYLAPGLLFLYINSVLTAVMISTGLEKKIPIMAAIALVFNLGFNLVLIPLYQHVGAAAMTSLTELLLTIISLSFIPRSLWPVGSVKVGLKALLASLLMALPVWFLQQMDYSLLVILPVAAVVYFGVATLLGTIPREDMRAFYSSIRHKAGRGKAGVDQAETTSGDVPFLTEEDMQMEREFVLALGHEMTNPLLPSFKSGMTNPVQPAFKSEMTHILPTYRSGILLPSTPRPLATNEIPDQVTTKLPDTPYAATIDEIPDQVTIRLPNTPDPLVIDDEPTVPLINAVRTRKKAQEN